MTFSNYTYKALWQTNLKRMSKCRENAINVHIEKLYNIKQELCSIETSDFICFFPALNARYLSLLQTSVCCQKTRVILVALSTDVIPTVY